MDADRLAIPEVNLRAFLRLIRACEGTAKDDGYTALFGYPAPGRSFVGFGDHPRRRFSFVQTDGAVNYTTAAGAYQIIVPTYDRLATKLRVTGFTPTIQDMMATELIAEAKAMAFVKGGDVQQAVDLCSPIWASLPASTYPQPKRTMAFAMTAYINAGGALA